jgi:hypothetical protein
MNKTPQSNPLAADIEEEYHTHLLERGNLNRPKRFTDWNEVKKPQFSASGYLVELNRFTCRCGNRYTHLENVFLVETSPENARRLTALNRRNFQPVPTFSVETTTYENTLDLCPKCLPFN